MKISGIYELSRQAWRTPADLLAERVRQRRKPRSGFRRNGPVKVATAAEVAAYNAAKAAKGE